jgi:predicted negative regulator of RcsB-dependent stress response
MATLETDDANILDAETINWRLIVYPLLVATIIIVSGFVYYYYLQNQKDQLEATARAALLQAKTPDELVKVADQYPHTDQAVLALLGAGDGYLGKSNFDSAIKTYQRIVNTPDIDSTLNASAQLGLASSFEASHKVDDAINTFLGVARLGAKSPYAPFAYTAAARLTDQRGDKDSERKILMEEAALDVDSPFVKQAQSKLKELNSAPPAPLTFPATATNAPASVKVQ